MEALLFDVVADVVLGNVKELRAGRGKLSSADPINAAAGGAEEIDIRRATTVRMDSLIEALGPILS